ncbi:hypothetical protein [Mitsuokella sp.]|uniref:hypothetical protein n=1 Tax=Mitsuokella sp. TaxID=2049034 RepID=UPI002A81187C|nr:hypothetical protein [Mitsuokella sp.]
MYAENAQNTVIYLPLNFNKPYSISLTNTAHAYNELITINVAATTTRPDFSGRRIGIYGGGYRGCFVIALGI